MKPPQEGKVSKFIAATAELLVRIESKVLGGNESRNTDVKSGIKRRKYQQPLAQSTFVHHVYAPN
jgi:hypothetical protein